MDIDTWSTQFEELSRKLPIGVINTIDGKPVKLSIVLEEGHSPLVFARIYIPHKVGSELGWFAQGSSNYQSTGLKCILMPKARVEVINRFGLGSTQVYVKSIRTIKPSNSGKSLLCEVSEW